MIKMKNKIKYLKTLASVLAITSMVLTMSAIAMFKTTTESNNTLKLQVSLDAYGNYLTTSDDFENIIGKYKEEITSIVSIDTIPDLSNYELGVNLFDVSNRKNKTVLATLENGVLTLMADGDINTPQSMTGYFENYSNVGYIDLMTFDMSETTNIERMFKNIPNLYGKVRITGTPNNVNGLSSSTFAMSAKTNTKGVMVYGDGTNQAYIEELANYRHDGQLYVYAALLEGTLMDGSRFNTYMTELGLKSTITEIVAVNTLPNINNYTLSVDMFDVSHNGDMSVLALIDGTKMTLATEGKLYSHPDSQYLFSDFTNVGHIDLYNWDTSYTTDMKRMFKNIPNLYGRVKISGSTSNLGIVNGLDSSVFASSAKVNPVGVVLYGDGTNDAFVKTIADYRHDGQKYVYVAKAPKSLINTTGFSYLMDNNSYKTIITEIETSNIMPDDLSNYELGTTLFDVSHNQDGSVIAYLEGTKLTIAANGEIITPDTIAGLFKGYTALTIADIRYFDLSETTNMSQLFYGCASLSMIDLSYLDVSSVVNMSEMFYGCTNLTTANVNFAKMTQLTTSSNMFYNCQLLETVECFDLGKSTNISGMFQNCYVLTSKFQITGTNITSYSNAFYYTGNKISPKYIVLYDDGTNTALVDNIVATKKQYGRVIRYTPGNKLLDITSFKAIIDPYKTTMTKFIIDREVPDLNGYTMGVDMFDASLFQDGSIIAYLVNGTEMHLTSTDIIQAPQTLANMFNGYTALVEVDILSLDMSETTDMSYMFANCKALKTANIKFEGNITNITRIFYYCENLSGHFYINTNTIASYGTAFQYAGRYAKQYVVLHDNGENIDLVDKLVATKGDYGKVVRYKEGNYLTDVSIFKSYFDANNTKYTKINTHNTIPDLSNYELGVNMWDVSLYGNNSVLAYIENNTELNIVANGTIIAPASISQMFYNYTSVTEINLGYVDFTNTTNVANAFRSMSKVQYAYALDQTNADKLNVSSNKPSNLVFVPYPGDRTITVEGDYEVNLPKKAIIGREVEMYSLEENWYISSYKVNGIGFTDTILTMPNEDIVITDIVKSEFLTYETPHNYTGNMNEITVIEQESTVKMTFFIEYQTYNGSYDYVLIQDENGTQLGKYYGTTKTKAVLQYEGTYAEIIFVSNSSGHSWGAKVQVAVSPIESEIKEIVEEEIEQEEVIDQTASEEQTEIQEDPVIEEEPIGELEVEDTIQQETVEELPLLNEEIEENPSIPLLENIPPVEAIDIPLFDFDINVAEKEPVSEDILEVEIEENIIE